MNRWWTTCGHPALLLCVAASAAESVRVTEGPLGAADARELVGALERAPSGKVRPLFDLLGGGIGLDEAGRKIEEMIRPEDAAKVKDVCARLRVANTEYLAGYYRQLVAENVTDRSDNRPWRVQVAQGALHVGLRRLRMVPVAERAKVAKEVKGEVGLALLYECCGREWPKEATDVLADLVPKTAHDAEWQNFSLALGAGLSAHKEDREALRPVVAAMEKAALELTASGAEPCGGAAEGRFRELRTMLCRTAIPLSDDFRKDVHARNERNAAGRRLPVCALILACDGDTSGVGSLLAMLDAPSADDRLAAATMWTDLTRYAFRSKPTDRKTGRPYSIARLVSLCAFEQNAAFAAGARRWWADGGSKMAYAPEKRRWLNRGVEGESVADPWESLEWGEPGKGPEAGPKFSAHALAFLDSSVTRASPHTAAGAILEQFAQEGGLCIVLPADAPAGLGIPASVDVRDVKVRDVLDAVCAGCRLKMLPLKDSERGLLLMADETPAKAETLAALGAAGARPVQRKDKVRSAGDLSRILREVVAEARLPGLVMTGYPRRLAKEEELEGEMPAERILARCAALVGATAGVRGRLVAIEAPLSKPADKP